MGLMEDIERRLGRLETDLYSLQELHSQPLIPQRDPIGDGILITLQQITHVDLEVLDRRVTRWHRPHFLVNLVF